MTSIQTRARRDAAQSGPAVLGGTRRWWVLVVIGLAQLTQSAQRPPRATAQERPALSA